MTSFPAALPCGAIEEIVSDVFFVSGQIITNFPEFPNVEWHFDRNMTVIREGDELTLVNSVRLDDDGLGALEKLGTVKHLVRIGALHGRDDAFYIDRYSPQFWAMPGIEPDGVSVDARLTADGATPFSGCTVFEFRTTKNPEGILIVDRAGGIAVACDALQNWVTPSSFFNDETTALMTELGFFQPANFGPLFMMRSVPEAADFERLLEHEFVHALCGHGEPLRNTAHEDFAATMRRVFDT